MGFYPKLRISIQLNNINLTLNKVRNCFAKGYITGLNKKKMDTGSNGFRRDKIIWDD
jgi:hypothetical protein